MMSELGVEARGVDPLIEIQSLGRTYASCWDESERATIKSSLLKLISRSPHHPREIIERWIRQEEKNVAIKAENRDLESELESLKAQSLAEEPVIPPHTPPALPVPAPDPVTAREIIDLHSRINAKYDARLSMELDAKLRSLDVAEAKILFDMCSRSPTAELMTLLGWCHGHGVGTPSDSVKATEWYQKSADLGNATSMNNLAIYLEIHGHEPGDKVRAFQWYQRSAYLEYPTGMYHYGLCFAQGIGTAQDHEKAIEWITEACDLEEPGAMLWLALHHETDAIPRDEKVAMERYIKSADLGYPIAMFRLGNRFLHGAGVPRDAPRGVRYMYQSSLRRDSVERRFEYYMDDDLRIEILGLWIREEDDGATLRARNQSLRTESEALRTELEYRPGGPGFREAREDFELRSGSHTSVPSGLGLDA